MVTYSEYCEIIRGIPETQDIHYAPAYLWPTVNVPRTAVSLNGDRGTVFTPEKDGAGRSGEAGREGLAVRLPRRIQTSQGIFVPVVSIAAGLFRGNTDVTDILLPASIQYLPDGAFAGCTNLRRITLPGQISYIGPGTFAGCGSLEDVYYEGTPEEWDRIKIVQYKHEVEFGSLVPGTPVQKVTAERRVHIPGNEPLLAANIHFHCAPQSLQEAQDEGEGTPAAAERTGTGDRGIFMGGRNVTDVFRAAW